MGDPLEKLNRHVQWGNNRKTLGRAFKKQAKGPGGRPPFEYVMTFKILILQKLYNMADGKTECLIKGRLSFQRFLGLGLCGAVPGAKTIWHFREGLDKAKIPGKIFNGFAGELEQKGIITHSGSMAGATFADAPKQRNAKEGNKEIKAGKIPEEWKEERNRHKKAQKDTDARRATKNKGRHYGYKNHVKVDKKSKIITGYEVTGAEAHGSRELESLIDEMKDKIIYGDSAYTGGEVQKCIPENVKNRIREKGYRNKK
jgi:IS5 family transposase